MLLPEGLISSDTYTVSYWINPEKITDFTPTFFGARNEKKWISFVPRGASENTMLWSNYGDD